MKYLLPIIILFSVVINCTKKENKTANGDILAANQTNKYKKISRLENISFSTVLYKKSTSNYKIIFKDSLGSELKTYVFDSTIELKELFSCDYLKDKSQKLVFVIDKNDSPYKVWSLRRGIVNEFKKEFSCYDYDKEESFD